MRTDEIIAFSGTGELPATLQRARGEIRLTFRRTPMGTGIATHFEEGSGRARILGRQVSGPAEAIIINSSGGMTGGDRFRTSIGCEAGAHAIVASQAAERIYRRRDGVAVIDTTLFLAEGAILEWLPQETIIFDRSAVRRRVVIDCASQSSLLAVEATVLGREAMGESVSDAMIAESWRVRRDGRLVFADGTRLPHRPADILAGPATAGGARALATLVMVAPHAEARLETAREALADGAGEAGVSAWNGMLIARLLAQTGQALRKDLTRLIEAIRGTSMPRVWNC